jgi:hypothetical protein
MVYNHFAISPGNVPNAPFGSITLAGFDRERVFYPVLRTVIATYYVLFAVMGGSAPALTAELWWRAHFSYRRWLDSGRTSGWLSPRSPDTEFSMLMKRSGFALTV